MLVFQFVTTLLLVNLIPHCLGSTTLQRCGNTFCMPDETCEVACLHGSNCPQPRCVPGPNYPVIQSRELCGGKVCKTNEFCLTIRINCRGNSSSTCIAPPPMCVARKSKHTEVKPVIVANPCTNVQCQPGYTCQPKANCNEKCPEKNFECVPINPCSYTTCTAGYDCVVDDTNPTTSLCVPRNPCAVTTCQPGYTCQVVTVNCLVAPCTPPYAQCVPVDPCSYQTCADGYECVRSETNPSEAVCVLKNPCALVTCCEGYTCNVVTLNCFVAPCSPSYAECVPTSPCAYTTCNEGYECITNPKNPLEAQCLLQNPCVTCQCGPGYTCNAVTQPCLGSSCPPPYPKCVPSNPCVYTNCAPGYVCSQCQDDPNKAECVLDPCSVSRCPFSTSCQACTTFCSSPPCARPSPRCLSTNPCDPNPCRYGDSCSVDENNVAVCYR